MPDHHLPDPIASYVHAANARDLDALLACFTEDPTVVDEGKTLRGAAAIRGWKLETDAKYQPSLVITTVADRGDATVVTALVSGAFPGSPITLEFLFRLEQHRIAALEIR